MKRILITGGSSYLGRCLREYLAQWPEDYSVTAISVRDDSWKAFSFSGFDAIYHTAALVHMEQNKNDPAQAAEYHRVNAVLPLEIARKAKAEGVRQFLFLSTASVYGLTAPLGQTVMITKDTPLRPVDNYGISKLEAENALAELEEETFRVAILRPPMIYGRGCKGNYRTLAAIAKKLPCFPYVDNQRSMLYVENLCRLVQLLIDDEARGIFCPQDRNYVNTCEMMREIAAANGRKIVLLPGFGWTLKLLGMATAKVDKAFGSLCYDRELSAYREDYCRKDLHEAILSTEQESL